MLTALIYSLRKATRLGIPIGSCAGAISLYGLWTGWAIISYISFAIVCIFIAVFGIFISVTWTNSDAEQERRKIKISIKAVQDHVKQKRIDRRLQLNAAPGKAGDEDPTIYEFTKSSQKVERV